MTNFASLSEVLSMKKLSSDFSVLAQKLEYKSPSFKEEVVRLYLRYCLSKSNSVDEAKEMLTEIHSKLSGPNAGTASDSSTPDVLHALDKSNNSADVVELDEAIQSQLKKCLDLLGFDGEGENYSVNEYISELHADLQGVREELAVLVKSKSGRNISSLLQLLAENDRNQRLRLDKSIDDLISTIVSAFEPEKLLNMVEENESSRSWLEKNVLFRELKNKHKSIEQYRDNGKFLRDFWIMYKINGQATK